MLGPESRDKSQEGQSVVLSKDLEEVLDGLAADSGAILELGNVGRLFGGGRLQR